MSIFLRVQFAAVCGLLACLGFAQDGVATAGAARTRYLGNLGMIPPARSVVVEDFVNYHRHEIPRPRAGESVALDLRWGSPSLTKSREAVLQIGLSTALVHDREHLKPLNLALVIDKSGSMSEANKLDRVKDALITLVSKLRPVDIVSIVAFDSDASVLLPAEPLGDGQRAIRLIRSLQPGSYTNISDGLTLGYQEALKHYDKGQTNRVILLTDGIANRGEVSPSKIADQSLAFNDRGIDLSTIGLGTDLNMDLLQSLAKSGRGLFHFIADSQDTWKVFDSELQSLVSSVATEPKLLIDCGPNFEIEKIYGYDPVVSGSSAQIRLNNMNSGMTEVVMLRLRARGETTNMGANVRLTYFDLGKGKEISQAQSTAIHWTEASGADALEDESVAKNYTIANLAQAMHDMASACEEGRFEAAERLLDEAVGATKKRYPSLEDPDVSRVLKTALQYQAILHAKTGHDQPAVPNGDFSLGNWGFASDLAYTAPGENCLWPAGYTIAPTFSHPQLHRLISSQEFAAPRQKTGNEQVMFANAGGTGALTVWSTRVHCKPNTRYRISFQSISLTPGLDWVPTFEIQVDEFRSAPQASRDGVYKEISTEWTSGSETSATLSIVRMPIPHGGGIIGIANIEMVEIPS